MLHADMSIYGHCPAHDDFFLVVCSHCGQVVKPQAFEKHCERRHGPLGKLYGDHSLSSPLKRPRPGRPPGQHSASREARDGRWQEPGSPRAPLPPAAHRPTKAQKEGVRLGTVFFFLLQLTYSSLHSVYPWATRHWDVGRWLSDSGEDSDSHIAGLEFPCHGDFLICIIGNIIC